MGSKKKSTSKLDTEQRELYEHARKRTLQKKRLFQHFIIFLLGAVFLIVINVVIGYKEDFMPLGYNWFVWAVLIWSFLFLLHVINVFITNKFMGKEWEDRQMERLVRRQKEKITELEQRAEKQYPVTSDKNPTSSTFDPEGPAQPFNS